MNKSIMLSTFLPLASVLFLLLLLNSCALVEPGNREDESISLSVYHSTAEHERELGELIKRRELRVARGTDLLNRALLELNATPDDEAFEPAFPRDVRITSYTVSEDGEIVVNMTPGFNDMSAEERVRVVSCIVLTLCELDEVETVTISIDGEIKEKELTSEQFLLPESEKDEYALQLTLYFADETERFLEAEQRVLTVRPSKSLPECIMEELKSGSRDSRSPIPTGTVLISCEIKRKICTLNLSADFYDSRSGSTTAERLTIYSIVNSITGISGIDAVQFLINGERIEKYGTIPLREPILRNSSIIRSNTAEQDEAEVNLYFGYEDTVLIALPTIIKVDNSFSLEHNILNSLIAAKECFGYTPLIPPDTQVLAVSLASGSCSLDLSSHYLDAANPTLANFAIVSSISDAGNVDTVNIYVDGILCNNPSSNRKNDTLILY